MTHRCNCPNCPSNEPRPFKDVEFPNGHQGMAVVGLRFQRYGLDVDATGYLWRLLEDSLGQKKNAFLANGTEQELRDHFSERQYALLCKVYDVQ